MINPTAPASVPNAEVVPPAPAAGPNAEVIQVPAKDWQQLQATVNYLAAQQRQQKTAPATPPVQQPEVLIPPKPQGQGEADKITERLNRNLRRTAIKEQIIRHGLADVDAGFVEAAFEGKYGQRIQVDGETERVYMKADDGSERGINEVFDDFFKPLADKFKPAKQGPSGDGLRSANTHTYQTHPMANMDLHQIMSHPNAALRAEFQQKYPEEFQRKQREAPARPKK